ncbi:MAG: hypothetical protein PVI67_04035 [Anaerolineae bacterium]
MDSEGVFCPECGADEAGYFCRNCGTLIRGEEMVLCPRCRQIVPHGEFCNQCGQKLGVMALDLHQLALAGDDFWVSDGVLELPEETDTGLLEPDDSVVLAEAELPDWLKELPTESVAAETKPHVYPSLRPIEEVEQPAPRGRFLTPVFLFLALLLLALVAVVVFLLLSGTL